MHKMNKNIISLVLLTASFYALSASDGQQPQPKLIPSLKDLALQRVVQTMVSKEEAQQFAKDPQQYAEHVESCGVSSGAIKSLIADQLLKRYRNEICCSKQLKAAYIQSIAWHPKEELLALGLDQGTIYLVDSKTEKIMNRLTGHRGAIKSVAWSPKGNLLASGSSNEMVHVWNRETGDIKYLVGHQHGVQSVAWHPTENILASGSGDRTIRVWDVHTNQELNRLEGHQGDIHSVAWHPDGNLLASGSLDGTVRIWDRHTGEIVKQFEVQNGIKSVTWNPEGNLLASGSLDEMVIWNSHTGQELKRLKLGISPADWNSEWNLLASGSTNGMVHIRDRYTGQELNQLGGDDMQWICSVAWHPERNLLASGSMDGMIRVWDVQAYDRLIDSLSLIQALYAVHRIEHADVIQPEIQSVSQGKQEEDYQNNINRDSFFNFDWIDYEDDISEDMFFDFDQIEESSSILKRKRPESPVSSSKRGRFESSSSSASSSSSSQEEELSASQAYMKDLEDSLPGELKRLLEKNKRNICVGARLDEYMKQYE